MQTLFKHKNKLILLQQIKKTMNFVPQKKTNVIALFE